MLAALAALLVLAAPAPELEIARALSAPPGGPRAVAATRPLLGAPYARSPLGEGSGRDPDPRFRLDAFDCMTLVETAIALGSATNLAEARLALDAVRYASAPPSFAGRNHEVLSQWLPANVARGFVADATSTLIGVEVRTAGKAYSAASWDAVRATGRAIPGLPRTRLPLGTFEAPVVAPGDVGRIAGQLPEGAVVFVVRADAPERPTRITHAGLVVQRPGGATLVRHATSSRGVERVIEEPIERFVRREERAFPRWPLEGLSFWAIRDASERVRRLAARPAPAPEAIEASPAPPPRRL